MRKAVIGLALLTGVAILADARAEYFDTGNQLLSHCNNSNLRTACVATIAAHFDMMQALGYKCRRDTVGVSREQVRDIVVKYLTDYPEDRQAPAAFLSVVALQKAFNCVRTEAK